MSNFLGIFHNRLLTPYKNMENLRIANNSSVYSSKKITFGNAVAGEINSVSSTTFSMNASDTPNKIILDSTGKNALNFADKTPITSSTIYYNDYLNLVGSNDSQGVAYGEKLSTGNFRFVLFPLEIVDIPNNLEIKEIVNISRIVDQNPLLVDKHLLYDEVNTAVSYYESLNVPIAIKVVLDTGFGTTDYYYLVNFNFDGVNQIGKSNTDKYKVVYDIFTFLGETMIFNEDAPVTIGQLKVKIVEVVL